MEVQPGSNRLADLWPQRAIYDFFLSLKFHIWSKKNTQLFDSYCTSKNVLFRGQSDLDPQTIDLNLYVTLPIEKLYQYKYVAQLQRIIGQ